MRRLPILLLLTLMHVGVARADVFPSPPAPLRVPMAAVLANPERYDGQVVEVSGFLNLEFEGDALYQGRADFDAMLTGNALWVDGPKFQEPAARRALRRHFVSVTGRFNAGRHGHGGLFAGQLDDVSMAQVQLSRRQVEASMFHFYKPLPWPLAIIVLLPADLLLAAMLAIRHRRSPGRPGAAWTVAAFALAATTAAFTLLRLSDLPWTFDGMMEAGFPAARIWPQILECGVGVVALLASLIFALRRNLQLCLLFAAAQLIIPAVIEARGFLIFEAPPSIYSAEEHSYEWRRPDPPIAVRPSGDPHRIDPPAT